jgi:arylformamidase
LIMWIDISVPIRVGMVRWPGDPAFQLARNSDMERDGTEYNVSAFAMGCHLGTHMDAPLHFLKDGATMDTMPLDATMGPCRVIQIEDPQWITIEEIEPYKIAAGERILFKTANSARQWRTDMFLTDFVHIPAPTAKYLAERRIRTVGVDCLSVGGFETDGAECHRQLLKAGIWIIEWLNLANVEPGDYELACLPLKMLNVEGVPARAAIKKLH